MRFNSHVALGLLASTLSNAIPTPQDEPSADALPTSASSDISEASDQLAQLLEFAQSITNATLEESSSKAKRGGCTLSKLSVRREWYVFGPFRLMSLAFALIQRSETTSVQTLTYICYRGSLSNTERKAYTDAVLCLQSKKSKTPSSLIPGAKSRFDDWVGTHINQTLNIHYTVRLPCPSSFSQEAS